MKRRHIYVVISATAAISLAAVAAHGGNATGRETGVKLRSVDSPTAAGASSTTGSDGGAEADPKGSPATHPPEASPGRESEASDAPSGRSPDGVPTAAESLGWELVASEEFNGTSVDRSRWTIYDGEGNGGVGWRRPEAISVSDGTLKITGRGDVSGGMNWNGGRTYGRWEVRARSDTGNGYAPNILMWPSSGNWPAEGEINIMEIPWGNRIQSLFVIHWSEQNAQVSHIEPGDFTRWHTFALEWLGSHITLFIDGEPIYTTADPDIVGSLRYPMHIALQNDVGPFDGFIPPRDATTPSEVSLEIDWVRLYAA